MNDQPENPFASPTASNVEYSSDPTGPAPHSSEYKPLKPLSTPTSIFIWLILLTSFSLLLLTAYEMTQPVSIKDPQAYIDLYGQESLLAISVVYMVIGLGASCVGIIGGIIFLCWYYRAHHNLGALKARELKFTSGWAVGYYFIPIANLFMPYQVLQEIWRESNPDNLTENRYPTAPFILIWWLSRILGYFLIQASNIVANPMLSGGAVSAESISLGNTLLIVALVIDFVAAFLCLSYIRQITQFQEQRYKSTIESTNQ